MVKRTQEPAGAPDGELVTVPDAQDVLKVGGTRFAELEREADFPKAIWLGPRGKRYLRHELLAWALKRRGPQGRAA